MRIIEFQGPWRFLSNFWRCTVAHDGILFPSAEHAYQAAKTLDYAARRYIATLNAGQAKRAGRNLVVRPDWDAVRLDVMADIVRDKFTNNPELRARLISTGGAVLEEGNRWGDRFWGICPPMSGTGQNHLGKILMQVRSQLKGNQ